MFKRIIEWIIGLFRGSRRRSDPLGGAVSAERVAIKFVNVTGLELDLFREVVEGGGRVLVATLQPGRSVGSEMFGSDKWIAVDVRSGRDVVDGSAGSSDDSGLIEITSEMVRAPSGNVVGPAGGVVLTFHNAVAFDVDLFQILQSGDEQHVATCPRDHSFQSAAVEPTVPWRARTVERGLELGIFIPSDEVVQAFDIPNTLIGFENNAFLDAEVCRVQASGVTSVIATLAPREFILEENYAAWDWTAIDPRSGRELASADAPRTPITVSIGESRLLGDGVSKDKRVRFVNFDWFPILIERVGPDGRGEPIVTIAPGGADVVDSGVGTPWRIHDAFTGNEVAMYVATAEAEQEYVARLRAPSGSLPRVPSAIEVVNETPLALLAIAFDHDGEAVSRSVVAAHSSERFDSFVGQPWVVRERETGMFLATPIAARHTPVTSVSTKSVRTFATTDPVDVLFENDAPFRVDVFAIDSAGERTKQHELEPADSTVVSTMALSAWEFRKHLSGEVVGMFIAGGARSQTHRIHIVSAPSHTPASIEFVNRTSLQVDVHRVDENGDEQQAVQTLGRREIASVATAVGTAWVVRDRHSGEVLSVAVGREQRQTIEVTSVHLRSLRSAISVDLSFRNDSWLTVDIDWIDFNGAAHRWMTLLPGATATGQTTFESHVWRVTSAALRSEVGLVIANDEATQTYAITSDFVRTARGTLPIEGEVALYDEPNFGGQVWVVDADVLDFGALPELANIGSMRVGASTGVTLFDSAGLTGRFTELHMDLPNLLLSEFTSQHVGSMRIWRIYTPSEAGITSRSTLVEDRRFDDDGRIEKYMSYRTILRVPPSVTELEITADGPITIDIEGDRTTVDTTRALRTSPNAISCVVLNIAATALTLPTLFVRTNTMPSDEDARIIVHPDVAAHQRIADMPPGQLYERQGELGLLTPLTREQADGLQSALANLTRTTQYTYHATPYGVHHRRQVSAANMEHPHWTLSLSDGRPSYQTLTTEEALSIGRDFSLGVAQSERDGAGLAARLPGDPGGVDAVTIDPLGELVGLTVLTVDNVGTDLVETGAYAVGSVTTAADGVGRRIGRSCDELGENLKNGDVVGAMGALSSGRLTPVNALASGGRGLEAGVVQGLDTLFGGVPKEFAKLVVIIQHFEDGVRKFVHDGVADLNTFVANVWHALGIEVHTFIAWLGAETHWPAVEAKQRELATWFETGITGLEGWLDERKDDADRFFGSIETTVKADIEAAMPKIPAPLTGAHNQLDRAHNEAVAWIEWIISQLVHYETTSPAAVLFEFEKTAFEGPLGSFTSMAEDALGPFAEKLEPVFAEALVDIKEIFSNPHLSPDDLAAAMLRLASLTAVDALEIANDLIDGVFETLRSMTESFRSAADATPDIPLLADFYRDATGSSLSLRNITTLLIALPTTLLESRHRPSPAVAPVGLDNQIVTDPVSRAEAVVNPPAATTTPNASLTTAGHVYAVIQLIQGVVTTTADAIEAAAKIKAAKQRYEMTEIDTAPESNSTALTQIGSETELTDISDEDPPALSPVVVAVVQRMLSVVAQMSGNPTELPLQFPPLDPSAEKDALRAPSEWHARLVWYVQWGIWGLELIGTIGKGFDVRNKAKGKGAVIGNLLTYCRPVLGVVHLGYMSGMLHADDVKYQAIVSFESLVVQANNTLPGGSEQLDPEWKKYMHWYEDNNRQGITRKHVSNVMDTVPEIGSLGFIPAIVEATDGISAAVSAVADATGFGVEGVVYWLRTDAGGLL